MSYKKDGTHILHVLREEKAKSGLCEVNKR